MQNEMFEHTIKLLQAQIRMMQEHVNDTTGVLTQYSKVQATERILDHKNAIAVLSGLLNDPAKPEVCCKACGSSNIRLFVVETCDNCRKDIDATDRYAISQKPLA